MLRRLGEEHGTVQLAENVFLDGGMDRRGKSATRPHDRTDVTGVVTSGNHPFA
jgi:hypothetical protein